MEFMNRFFKLSEHNTNVRTELIAGLTTFVTMAYIIFVNPNILSATGMDKGALFVATCLGAAAACILMGLYANWPVGLAPGMGMNAFFTYAVVLSMGHTWQVALGGVFLSGILFMVLSFTSIRSWLLNSIPTSMRYAMSAGVGLFLGIIGLKTAGIVVDHQATLVTIGDLTKPSVLLAAMSFLLICVLAARNIFGAVLLSIFVVTLIGMFLPEPLVQYTGIVSAPPSIAPIFMQLDIEGALSVGMVSVILTFLFINMFDTAGTLMGVATKANLMDKDGKIQNLNKSLQADSTSSVVGTFFGCSPVTSYVESASGVAAGGRTGLTAVTIGILFLAATFLAPLAGMIPAYATAGALLYVAMLMITGMREFNWDDMTDLIPAVVTAIMMPLTFSIAEGIALGFITYTVLKTFTGRVNEVSLSIWVLTAIFVAKYAFL